LLVTWTFALLRLAVLVRVLGSWLRQGRWSPWTRWAYGLTDWFMEPLSRVVPTIGMLDITPIIAYFGLGLLQRVVLSAL
jgi:YggT family protein